MQRWHDEVTVMARRKKVLDAHFADSARRGVRVVGRDLELGDFRKRRPFQSCPPSNGCRACQCERCHQKLARRRERRSARQQISAELLA